MGNTSGADDDKVVGAGTAGGTTTDTDTSGAGAGAGRGRGRPRDGEKVKRLRSTPKSDLVDAPIPTAVTLPKAPAEDAPKKKSRKKRKQPAKISSEQIESVIVAGSGIVAARTSAIWQIDSDEAKLIAEPLANILSKVTFLNEHSDEAILAFAVLMVLGPRIVMQVSASSEKKEGADGHEKRASDGGVVERRGESDAATSSDSASHTPAVFPVIS